MEGKRLAPAKANDRGEENRKALGHIGLAKKRENAQILGQDSHWASAPISQPVPQTLWPHFSIWRHTFTFTFAYFSHISLAFTFSFNVPFLCSYRLVGKMSASRPGASRPCQFLLGQSAFIVSWEARVRVFGQQVMTKAQMFSSYNIFLRVMHQYSCQMQSSFLNLFSLLPPKLPQNPSSNRARQFSIGTVLLTISQRRNNHLWKAIYHLKA
jgi:hypothetical protein